jgi:hypothetical protein
MPWTSMSPRDFLCELCGRLRALCGKEFDLPGSS